MTTAIFQTEGENITAFTLSGHSGFAAEGSDIVCAAVTSAVRLTECTLNTVLGLSVPFEADESSAAISCHVPDISDEEQTICQSILVSLMVYLTELREEYPNNIDVIEQ